MASIVFTRLLGWGLSYIRQPRVIAEVIGGILLGPTVFGRIPHFSQHIFPTESLPFLNLVSTLGLVLFLFLVGVEVDLRTVTKCYKEAASIGLIGMIIPFGLGAAVSVGIYNDLIDHSKVNNLGHFILFTGVAMAITAFPVLARILTETRLTQTRVGVIVLAAGVSNDVVGWILLALTVALVNAASGLTALWVLLVTVAWALVLFLLIKPAFIWFVRKAGAFENGPNQVVMTITLLLVFVSAWVTDIIGVHPIFGSFLVGLIIPHEGGFAVALFEKIEDLVAVLFLPIYFALSGLKTNLGALDSGLIWGYLIAIIAIAFFSKFGGCFAAAKWCGMTNRESLAVGTLMSCKGLVELIVLNIGLQAGILDTRIFSMFVVMAVVSTIATTPLTLLVYPHKYRTYLTGSAIAKAEDGSKKEEEDHHDAGKDREGAGEDAFSRKRLLVVLDKFEHLPGLMTLIQLMKPSEASLIASASAESDISSDAPGQLRRRQTAEKGSGSSEGSSSDEKIDGQDLQDSIHVLTRHGSQREFAQPDIAIDALRLIELTDRTSAVMKVSESEVTMRADPIINVFRTFGYLNRMPVRTSMAVVPTDQYSETVVTRASNVHSNLVIVPWTVPRSAPANEAAPSTSSALPNPFDSIFGRNAGASSSAPGERYSPHQANFVRKVFQTAECDVGVLLSRPTAGSMTQPLPNAVQRKSILVAFFGGPDDRAALTLAVRLCATNPSIQITVLRFKRAEAGEGGDAALPSLPPTMHHLQSLHHAQGGNSIIQDTMYPTNAHTSLEATLADDLAISKAQEQSAPFAGRFTFRELSTARVLRDLILTVEAEQPTIVVVGRGRKAPAMTHREELRFLLINGTVGSGVGEDATTSVIAAAAATQAKDRALNSETCKVIGEPAMALTLAKTAAATLVLASSMQQSSTSAPQA